MSADQFSPKVAKISIGSLDGGPKVEAQYNPKELEIQKTVPWSKVNEANKSNGKSTQDQGIHLEFTGAEGRSISVELLFDGYEKDAGGRGVDVSKCVSDLETLASVRVPGSKKEDERRPHRCVVTWGTVLSEFRCVIDSLSTKYTMFSPEGKPLRATCVVKLKEADVVSMGKKK
jgi:hypothetical protein